MPAASPPSTPGPAWRPLAEGVAFDPCSRALLRDGETAPLTELECDLLAYLHARPGVVVAREELLRAVWGYRDGVQSRAVDFTVTRLRKKLERDPSAPALLQSVRGLGYRLAPPPRPPDAPDAPDPGPLVGRDDARAWLLAALDAPEARVLVHGPPGVGKTALILSTLQAAGQRPRPWERMRYVDLSRAADPDDGLSALFAALGLRPPRAASTEEALAALARAAPRALLAVDGADAPGHGALLRALIQAPPGPALLLGARSRASRRGLACLELGPLGPEAAVALLLDQAPDLDPQDPTLRALAAALDHLPLALQLAAPMLRVLSPADLHARLAAHLGGDGALLASLDESLAWSWSRLAPAEQAALAQLSVFSGGFDADLAEAVLDLSPWPGCGLLAVLQRLRDASLITAAPARTPGLRLGLLDRVRAFAARRAAALGCWEPAVRAHRAALLAAAPQGVSQLGLADKDGYTWLERERENLLAAVERVAQAPEEAEARLRLTWALFPLCGRSLSVRRTLGLLDEALLGSPRLSDGSAALGHHMRGFCLAALGRYQEAGVCFARSWEAADRIGNAFGRMVAAGNLKSVALLSGRLEAAWRHGQAALADAPPEGRHRALYRQDLARILRGAGRIQEAEALLLALLAASPPRETTTWMARARLAELALDSGDAAACRAHLAEVERHSRARREAVPEPMLERYLASLHAVLRLAEGDWGAAARALVALAPAPDGLADDDDAVERAGALWLHGDAAAARASLDRSLGGPGLAETPLLAGTALCLSAIVEAEGGDVARSASLLTEARARLAGCDAAAAALWLALAGARLDRARGATPATTLAVPTTPPALPDRQPPDPAWCPPLPRALLARFGLAGLAFVGVEAEGPR